MCHALMTPQGFQDNASDTLKTCSECKHPVRDHLTVDHNGFVKVAPCVTCEADDDEEA